MIVLPYMRLSRMSRIRLIISAICFILAYTSVWFFFWTLSLQSGYDSGGPATVSIADRLLTLLSLPGFWIFQVSIPVQLLVQSLLEFFGLVEPETFGAVSYARRAPWAVYLIASITVTLIANIIVSFSARGRGYQRHDHRLPKSVST